MPVGVGVPVGPLVGVTVGVPVGVFVGEPVGVGDPVCPHCGGSSWSIIRGSNGRQKNILIITTWFLIKGMDDNSFAGVYRTAGDRQG